MTFPTPTVSSSLLRPTQDGPWPEALDAVLSPGMAEAARAEIAQWSGYQPTPMRRLDRLAAALGLGAVDYKDEGARFGLGSFKALGGAYAVVGLAAERAAAALGRPVAMAEVRGGLAGALTGAVGDWTVVTATDGNHGRSVAWGARMVGARCRIYVHAEVSAGRVAAMEAFGAEVVRVDGDYDHSVRTCAEEADANGWTVVSDTSWEGYRDIPRRVMAGYTVMADEALDQLAAPPTHLVVQAGVGGLAAAVAARFWQLLGADRPRLIVVEPTRAACCLASARAGRPTAVPLDEETMMAGLSCGEISLLAWAVLDRAADAFLAIGEEAVAPTMRMLADGTAGGGRIIAGESAVPGLIGLIAAAGDTGLRDALDLDETARILVFGCEGATDPEIYARLVGRPPDG